MNLKQKIFYLIVGFVVGIFFLLTLNARVNSFDTLFFQIGESKAENSLKLVKASELIESGKIKEVRMEDYKAVLRDHLNEDFSFSISSDSEREFLLNKVTSYNSSNSKNIIAIFESPSLHLSENSIPHLFQIIFILFIISPPIIVILLLVIIKKMGDKSV